MPADETLPQHADPSKPISPAGMRLRRIIILETLIVAFLGFTVWGVLWELGFMRVGLAIAIVIWLTVSPAIEIATVMKYRERNGDI